MDTIYEELHNKYESPITDCDCVKCESTKNFDYDFGEFFDTFQKGG